MSMSIKNSLNVGLLASISALTFCPVANAYDTDIYFSNATSGTGTTSNHADQPNILFVLDTSGSMGWDMDKPFRDTGPSRMSILKNSMNTIIDSAQNVNIGIMRFSYEGGAVSYPVADINADAGLVETQQTDVLIPVIPVGPFTINRSVSASEGDAKEIIDLSRAVSLTDVDLPATEVLIPGGSSTTSVSKTINSGIVSNNDDGYELVGLARTGYKSYINLTTINVPVYTDKTKDWNSLRVGGFRFVNLDIPKDAIVTDARLKLVSSQTIGGEVDWKMTVDRAPKSAQFLPGEDDGITQYKDGFGAAVLRDDTIDNPGSVIVGWNQGKVKKDNTYTSPNISELLNEVVGNPAWDQADNAVSLFLWPNPQKAKVRRRSFYSFEAGNTDKVPKLEVTYSHDAASPPVLKKHTLGFHFKDLRVPQGAKIKSARLQISAAKSSSKKADFTIYAENTDNAAPFKAVAGNITGRNKTTTVNWPVPVSEAWVSGTAYESDADLAPILQQIVDRTGWCGGNDLALILEGSGERAISSFDAGSAVAPKIIVEYENDFSGSETGCTVNETAYQISTSSADADENKSTGSVNTSASTIRFGSDHWTGFNFSGIQVPAGSDVQGAYLSLTSDSSGSANVRVYAHLTDNSGVFSSTSDNISTRTRTGGNQSWNVSAPAASSVLVSPDFSNVINEVVSLPAWQTGGGISVILGNGSGALEAKSFESSAFDSARLLLRYKFDLVKTIAQASGITVRQRLKEVVNDLPASGGTPATDTLYEVIRYLKGDTVEWGSQRMPSWARYANGTGATKRTSIAASYSPLGASLDIPSGCPSKDSNDNDCAGVYIDASPLPKYVSPIVNSCQNTYVVLLSDGDPNSMVGESKIRALTGGSCPDGDDGVCAATLGRYMSTQDLLPTALPGDQKVTLHTIRFAEDADPSYLVDLAAAGGGKYYDAPDEASLLAAFNSLVKEAVTKPQSFAAPSVALSAYNRLQTGSNLFYSMFLPHTTKRWEGNVKHYQFDADVIDVVGQNNKSAFSGDTVSKDAQSFWSNASTIDGDKVDSGGAGERMVEKGHANRNVYTYTGGGSPSNVAFANGIHELSTSNSLATSASLWPAGMSASQRKDMIEWIRGKDLDDSDADGSKVDTRWVLADPLHSEPVSITYDGGADEDDSSDDNVKIFVGTNGGAFHAIDGSTGEELWSFIPTEMLAVQEDMRTDANGLHVYGIDGRISAWVNDANKDGDIKSSTTGDQVILYVPFGRGARSLYAFDVTNPIAPKIVWKIDNTTTGFNDLGQTWSKPAITKLKIGGVETHVLIMGGGFDPVYDAPAFTGSASMGKGVYIIDALTGQRLLWIADDIGADLRVAGMNSAIPTDIKVVDIIGPDGIADRLYFGDLLGRLWRVDLTSVSRNNPGSSIAHMVADLNGAGEEAGRRFFRPPLAVPFSDSGSVPTYIYLAMVSGDIHNPLYKKTFNAAFAVKDKFELLKSSSLPTLLTLVKGESNAAKGILDITEYETSKKPDVPNGYYFKLEQNDLGQHANVGRVGLSSGSVTKISVGTAGEVDFQWDFSVYDPSVNNTAAANECSSSVVGQGQDYYVLLRDGFPSANVGNDPSGDGSNCYDCGNAPEDRYKPGKEGIPSEKQETGKKDKDGNVVCVDVSGFTILTPGGKDQCTGANTYSTYWWRSR